MPRLLVLCEHPTLLGGERSFLSLADNVARAGFDVALMAPPEGPLARAAVEAGLDLVPFRSLDYQGRRLPQPRRREFLAAELAHLRPDLLHANSLAMARLAGPVAAALDVPSLGHLRDIVRLTRRAIDDLNRNTRLVAVSEATRRFHVAAGLSTEKTHVLYNGVDLAQFAPRAATGYLHRQLGIPETAPLVGTIGQIGPRKGQDVLAQAAALLGRAHPEAHFVVVGQRWSDKAESRRFERDLIDAAGQLDGRMHLLGARDDVPRLLNELTILAHPARQEPLGRVLLEAAASGVAVVATDAGGTSEIFPPDAKAARLVPPDEPEALAEAIADLLADPSARREMAARARRRAESAFDRRQAAAGLVEHYRATLG
ncbi:MAG: glycosyltransferase family 4 protein [Pirellulales bacterium]|nr:glycosyltransferase family 4 protein [Pirellulales bacterium]